jgi:hypothetical protein
METLHTQPGLAGKESVTKPEDVWERRMGERESIAKCQRLRCLNPQLSKEDGHIEKFT